MEMEVLAWNGVGFGFRWGGGGWGKTVGRRRKGVSGSVGKFEKF